MNKLTQLLTALALITSAAPHTAKSETLPAASWTQNGTGTSGTYSDGIGTISINGYQPYFDFSCPTCFSGPTAGDISLTYWFEVLGPANASVPVDFLVNATGAVDRGGTTISATLGSNPAINACTAGPPYGGCPSPYPWPPISVSASQLYYALTNTPTQITLTGRFFLGCCGDGYFGGGTATGAADAAVQLDPSVTTAGYTIEYSPVPLPAVGWLLGPAFGVLGYRKRRVLGN
jgi:hypothetical protein